MENKEFWALHAVIFKKPYNIEKAKEDAKEFIKDGKKQFYRETVKSYRFRNIAKSKFIKGHFKTKKINKEISLIFGQLKEEHNHLEGAGIKDFIYKPIRKIKEYFKPRQGYNNTTTKNLKLFGDLPIKSLQIVRTPIMNAIDKVLNIVSLGKWSQLKKEYSFDKLFHLALIANVGNKNLVIEKNEVINVSTSYKMSKDSEVMEIPLNGKIFTTNEMLKKTLERIGSEKFYLYDGFKFNCQVFVRDCLESEGLYSEQAKEFLFQDLEELAKKMPAFSKKIMNITTDLGASVNKITGQAKPKLTAKQEAEAEFWRQNQAIRNKLSMETNEANKPFMEEQRKKKDEKKLYWETFLSFLEKEGYNRNGDQSYQDFIKQIENTKGFFPFPKKNGGWEWRKTKDIPITMDDLGVGGKILNTIGLGEVTESLLNVYNSSVKVAQNPTIGNIADVGKAGVDALKKGVEANKAGIKGAVKTTAKNVAKEAFGGAKMSLKEEFLMDKKDHDKKLKKFEESDPDIKQIEETLKGLREISNNGLEHIEKLEKQKKIIGGTNKNIIDLLKLAEENEKNEKNKGKTVFETAMEEIGKNFNTKGKPKTKLTFEPVPEPKAQPKKKQITGKAQEQLLMKEFRAKEREFKKLQTEKEKERKAKERELKKQKNLKLYFGIDEVPKGYRRASMEEAMKKKKINYWGLKKVDNKILMITDEVPDKNKLNTLILSLTKNKGIFDKFKKEFDQQTALKKDTTKIKEQLEEAKQILIKTNNEYQQLNNKLKK